MNFYDLNQNLPPQLLPSINNQLPVDINYKINEIENRLKKIELRIQRLENSQNNNFNNNEPDTGLYMI